MKVVVAGANGFVGRPLCAALVAEGHEVVGLVRRPDAADLPSKARPVRWDARPL